MGFILTLQKWKFRWKITYNGIEHASQYWNYTGSTEYAFMYPKCTIYAQRMSKSVEKCWMYEAKIKHRDDVKLINMLGFECGYSSAKFFVLIFSIFEVVAFAPIVNTNKQQSCLNVVCLKYNLIYNITISRCSERWLDLHINDTYLAEFYLSTLMKRLVT
jgi:hypothetical protein